MLVYLRRLDAKMDGLREDMADVKRRLTSLGVQVGLIASIESRNYAQTALRLDRIETRLERLERSAEIISA